MDNDEKTMRRRFEELAPWRVNGTLSEADRAWVDDYVRLHPGAAAELDWYASLREEIKAGVPQVAPDIGLDKLLGRVRTEKQRRTERKVDSFIERLIAPVRDGLASLVLRPAYAYAAAALVVVQAGVIGALVVQQYDAEREFAEIRSIATVPISGPVLRVSFKADAKEADIRQALIEVGGTLVGGPGQLGEYIVFVSPRRIDVAMETLRLHAAVEAVEVGEAPAPPALR
jgi:hypothetical protein